MNKEAFIWMVLCIFSSIFFADVAYHSHAILHIAATGCWAFAGGVWTVRFVDGL